MNRSSYSQEPGYVNIHGDDIRTFVCDKTGAIVVPIEELRNMGVRIYHKNQYSKLLIDDSQFTAEFDLYMLQAAQTYMLEHKITFREEDILASINKVKQKLTGHCEESDFTRDHRVESIDNNITVSLREPSALTIKNIQSFKGQPMSTPNFQNTRLSLQNDRKLFTESPGASVPNRRSEGVRNQRNGLDKTPTNLQTPQISHAGVPRTKSELYRKVNEEKTSPNGDIVPRERLPQVELKKPKHNVIVTFVEKPNVCWVQDFDNADVLLDIDEKVRAEAAKASVCSSKFLYNKMYLAPDDGIWYRCKVIKFKPVTVFFVDYGNCIETNQLKEISDELGAIPCQAVKITFSEPAFKPEVGMNLQVQIKSQYNNGTYVVVIISSGDETPPVKPEPEPEPEPELPEEETFFDKPSPMCKLENDQKVMAVAINDGKLTVRTKECYDKVRKIEKALGQVEALPLRRVLPGQLVLCNKDGKLHRARVTGVRGSSVDVEFLDYNENIKVDISALTNISANVASEPITYIVTPKVKGYTAESEQIIKDLITSKAKMTVVLTTNEFDLKVGEELLSSKLSGQTQSDRLMLTHLKRYKPEMGVDQYIFNSMRSIGDLSFAHDETFQEHMNVAIKTEMEDSEPYTPIVGEVCYGFFEDSWFRCVVIDHNNNFRYKVQFIDFGNVEALTKELLRKATDEIKTAPIIAIPCKLTGVPQVKNCEELVQKYLETFGSYEVNFKRFDGEIYEIEIPSLYEKLRSA